MRSKGRKESLSDSRDLDGSYDQLTGECRPPGKVQQPVGTTARGRPREPRPSPGHPRPARFQPRLSPGPPARPASPHALPGEGWATATPALEQGDSPGLWGGGRDMLRGGKGG